MIDVELAWEYLLAQSALGPRHAGSPGHAAAQQLLFGWLAKADWRREQAFTGTYFSKSVTCKNLWGHYRGDEPGRILLGSHFDTRPWADNDPDAARRQDPVPGANDGASGVALLAAMDGFLRANRARPSVDVVFFDAEDWHEIDGHSVSEGSKRFVADLAKEDWPNEVVIVDMVAGSSLMLDADLSSQDHEPSYALTLKLFQLGYGMGLPAFTLKKPSPYKWIGCDHTPFMAAGIASAILIDIDYPPWHTVDDLPEHCSQHSLAQVARVLEAYVLGT